MTKDDILLTVLNRLAAENRQWRRVATVALALFAVLTCTAMAMQQQGNAATPAAIQEVLRTRRLELANADGEVVAILQTAATKEEPGWLTEYHKNGRRAWRVQVKNNRYSGKYVAWWPSGIKSKEATYQDGREHGLCTTFHSNGQPSGSGAYDRGKQTGIWIAWHSNGQKIAQGLYERGARSGEWKEWHAGGEVFRVGKYDHGLKTGTWTEWYSNGQKRREGTYEADTMTGEWKYWTANGGVDPKRSGAYQNGRRVK
jgi:antitoxin component YwqK of YwqJK toxin-antitoxin module